MPQIKLPMNCCFEMRHGSSLGWLGMTVMLNSEAVQPKTFLPTGVNTMSSSTSIPQAYPNRDANLMAVLTMPGAISRILGLYFYGFVAGPVKESACGVRTSQWWLA